MERLTQNSSNTIMKTENEEKMRKGIKLGKVYPADLLEKELAMEGSVNILPRHTTISSKRVYSAKKGTKSTLQNLFHIRPIFSLGIFLKRVELISFDSSFFKIEKTRSIPYTKYTINDAQNKQFQLISNVSGSKYFLQKDGVTYFTLIFEVGCGNVYRRFTMYVLRSAQAWKSLLGNACTQDLSQLYEKGNNCQQIVKYESLPPLLCPQKDMYMMQFSRKDVIPSVQNTIICTKNGEKILQMVKIDQNEQLFQISASKTLRIQILLAFAIASFDFKLSIQ